MNTFSFALVYVGYSRSPKMIPCPLNYSSPFFFCGIFKNMNMLKTGHEWEVVNIVLSWMQWPVTLNKNLTDKQSRWNLFHLFSLHWTKGLWMLNTEVNTGCDSVSCRCSVTVWFTVFASEQHSWTAGRLHHAAPFDNDSGCHHII